MCAKVPLCHLTASCRSATIPNLIPFSLLVLPVAPGGSLGMDIDHFSIEFLSAASALGRSVDELNVTLYSRQIPLRAVVNFYLERNFLSVVFDRDKTPERLGGPKVPERQVDAFPASNFDVIRRTLKRKGVEEQLISVIVSVDSWFLALIKVEE